MVGPGSKPDGFWDYLLKKGSIETKNTFQMIINPNRLMVEENV